MTARDLAAFVADLRDYNSGVARARVGYRVDTANADDLCAKCQTRRRDQNKSLCWTCRKDSSC